jgi:hypothetical protein
VGWVLALVLGTGCGREQATTAPPVEPPPPEIVEVHPAPRSIHVPDQPEIWARFASALDPATVNETTIRLRVDTRRIAISVAWDEEERRVRITPLVPLDVRRTHTVELGADLATREGGRIGRNYRWQFTTVGVRRPGSPSPPDGTESESPFVMLAWDATDPGAGTILYRVHSGTDSSAVAARTSAAAVLTRSYYVPFIRWPSGTRTYWSVTALNQTTGEQSDGPVWTFDTLPVDAPADSVVLLAADWGHWDAELLQQVCFEPRFSTGGARFTAGIRWDLSGLRGMKLAAASIVMPLTFDVINPRPVSPTLWGARESWNACDLAFPGPPFSDGDALALGAFPSSRRLRFASDQLTAHLEAALRGAPFHGYIPRSNSTLEYFGPQCALNVTFYRTAQNPIPALHEAVPRHPSRAGAGAFAPDATPQSARSARR